jgi:hypothetical protein
MTNAKEKAYQTKCALRNKYGELYDRLVTLFFQADPVGINFVVNTEEYDLEVGTILPRLPACTNATDVQTVVHEEFLRWFGHSVADPFDHYQQLGHDIWIEVQKDRAQGRLLPKE